MGGLTINNRLVPETWLHPREKILLAFWEFVQHLLGHCHPKIVLNADRKLSTIKSRLSDERSNRWRNFADLHYGTKLKSVRYKLICIYVKNYHYPISYYRCYTGHSMTIVKHRLTVLLFYLFVLIFIEKLTKFQVLFENRFVQCQ